MLLLPLCKVSLLGKGGTGTGQGQSCWHTQSTGHKRGSCQSPGQGSLCCRADAAPSPGRMIVGLLAGLLFGKMGYYLLLSWCCVTIFVFMVRQWLLVLPRPAHSRPRAGSPFPTPAVFSSADTDSAPEDPGRGCCGRGAGAGGQEPAAHVPDHGCRWPSAPHHVLAHLPPHPLRLVLLLGAAAV